MKEIFAYKVVIEINDKLYSAWINYQPEAITEYKINKWVGRRKNCGPLGTFSYLEDAIKFKKVFCSKALIYKCKIKKSKYSRFWFYSCKYYRREGASVANTTMAEKVMLLHKINTK